MALELLEAAQDLGSALEAFATVGHNAALGIIALGHGDGWIEYRLDWRSELTDDPAGERIAQGAIFSLLDTTCSLTAWAKLGRFKPSPTLDFRVDFLEDAGPAQSSCRTVRVPHDDPDLAFMRGFAHEGDPADPVAQCVGTFMFVNLKA